jgi:hypothetical protein
MPPKDETGCVELSSKRCPSFWLIWLTKQLQFYLMGTPFSRMVRPLTHHPDGGSRLRATSSRGSSSPVKNFGTSCCKRPKERTQDRVRLSLVARVGRAVEYHFVTGDEIRRQRKLPFKLVP